MNLQYIWNEDQVEKVITKYIEDKILPHVEMQEIKFIDMPFSQYERLSRMHPGRLLAKLQEKNCVTKLPRPFAELRILKPEAKLLNSTQDKLFNILANIIKNNEGLLLNIKQYAQDDQYKARTQNARTEFKNIMLHAFAGGFNKLYPDNAITDPKEIIQAIKANPEYKDFNVKIDQKLDAIIDIIIKNNDHNLIMQILTEIIDLVKATFGVKTSLEQELYKELKPTFRETTRYMIAEQEKYWQKSMEAKHKAITAGPSAVAVGAT